jgi:hypothetical protein
VSKKTERHRSSVRFFCCVTSTESGRGVVNCQNMAVTGFFLLDVSIMSVHIFVHCARGPNWYARTYVCYALCFVLVSSAKCWISASCRFTFLGMVLGGPTGMPGPRFAMLCVLFGFRAQWVYCAGRLSQIYRRTRVTLTQKEVRQKRSIREKQQAEECFADNCDQPKPGVWTNEEVHDVSLLSCNRYRCCSLHMKSHVCRFGSWSC